MPYYITKGNCRQLTGFSYLDIIGLTGILGVHSFKEISNYLKFFLGIYSDRIIDVEISTPFVPELQVRINLFNKSIYNQSIEGNEEHKNIGLSLLSSQVIHAQAERFKTIWLNAWGNINVIDEYNGYITWGKLGYQMVDDTLFLEKMKELNREEKSLHELLSTKEGEEIWKKNGFEWLGKFDLKRTSENLLILKNLQDKKFIFNSRN